tara:strand:+ start:998 stop:1180 length:183 start_codon:yes stop_codon:yes gene_type:complete
MKRILTAVLAMFIISSCTHKIEVSAKEPITLNINLKIDHEIKVKVDKQLDDIFSDDSDVF